MVRSHFFNLYFDSARIFFLHRGSSKILLTQGLRHSLCSNCCTGCQRRRAILSSSGHRSSMLTLARRLLRNILPAYFSASLVLPQRRSKKSALVHSVGIDRSSNVSCPPNHPLEVRVSVGVSGTYASQLGLLQNWFAKPPTWDGS